MSAIMECLLKLTELLMIRIHHWNDPLMYNHKIVSQFGFCVMFIALLVYS